LGELEDPGSWRRLAVMVWAVLRLALGAYALWLVLACLLQRKVLFPTYVLGEPPSEGISVSGGEQAWLETSAGRVEWWYFPHPELGAPGSGPLVLYTHGNAELIHDQVPLIERYRDLGFHVLLVEYRGYGRSASGPSQATIVEDQGRVLESVLARPEVDASRLLLHGRSVGTGVACALVQKFEPRAVVLTSPFTSVRAMFAGYGVPGFLAFDPFDNARALAQSDVPVLILHGDRDGTIPHEHGERLAGLREGIELVTLPGFGHNDLPVWGSPAQEALKGFLGRVELVD
jgi:pimeloyl-ACP methyl ester carboxylesterase